MMRLHSYLELARIDAFKILSVAKLLLFYVLSKKSHTFLFSINVFNIRFTLGCFHTEIF